MSWNIAPECVSIVVICIIWIYSRKGNPIPSLKNRLFQACFLVTFCAMTSNILSTFLIYYLGSKTFYLTWTVTTIYFITTPLMGMVYFFYAISNIYENQKRPTALYFITALPVLFYVSMVLRNPITRNIFDISADGVYSRGKYIAVTYLIFYLYCFAGVLLVVFKGKMVPAATRAILFSFPLIAAAVIVVQQLASDIVLSGTAATCALLLIYLNLQNKQISIDYLTGIPNRQEFLKMLKLKLKQNQKRPMRFVVIVVSLNGFKVVNDIYGQHNGDVLLAAVSGFLKSDLSLRESRMYRYSGDEFALLIEDTKPETIRDIVEKISFRMTQRWETEGCVCMLSAAMGIVSYPESSGKTEGLINGLEYAISLAKSNRELHNVCYCDSGLLRVVKRRRQIVTTLKECLENDGFEMNYQPILSVEENSFVLAESLLRINHSPLGKLSPAEFIPIAEECGFIIDITYVVFDKVCQYIRQLIDRDIYLDGVSVNFSTLQFSQRDLIPRIIAIMEQRGVPFSKIKIEITESTLAENLEVVTDFANRMHEIGVRIGLDDFGTGYSNLSSVISLPINTIKLDKSLVWSALENDKSAITVRNLTRTFRELGMVVLAEGVETEEQSRFVRECGCSLIQGFLYARPMADKDFIEFMEANAEN